MRKIVSAFCLLIAAALIFAGAMLPRISAAVTDGAKNKKNGSAPLQSIELDLENNPREEEAQPDEILYHLSFEKKMYTVAIQMSRASMTEEEVYAAADKAMADYAKAGIFEWFPYTFLQAEPVLAINTGSRNSESIADMRIIWCVSYVHEGEPYQSLSLHIDDETGKIFDIWYADYANQIKFDKKSPEYEAYMNNILDNFTRIYFDQLGLSERKQECEENGFCEERVLDNGASYVREYIMGYGNSDDISILFQAEPDGFTLYIS